MTLSRQDFAALAGIVGANYGHQSPDQLMRAIINYCTVKNTRFDPARFMASARVAADHWGQAWQVPATEAELLAGCERDEFADVPLGDC